MKRLFYSCALLFLCNLSVQARHIIGGEITYECLGYKNDDPSTNIRLYQFYMKIYRDCQGNGANFDSAFGSLTGTVTIYRGVDEEEVTTIFLNAPLITDIDPDPGNPCVIVPPNICAEEGIYEFPILELPVVDESYYIIYQRCCRNVTINNIINPEDSGATYYMELTAAAQEVCNNSPTFNEFPPLVLCANEPFTFDHGATDQDGDQLVYEFCSPFLGGGPNQAQPNSFFGVAPNPDAPPSTFQDVQFIVPNYNFENPLGTDSELFINSSTGLLQGEPAFLGQFVVGICVSEYRNGQLLSTVRRDFQFNVANCEVLVQADIEEDEIVNGNEFVINSCGENTVTFVNQSFLEQNIDTYKWEFFLAGDIPNVFNDWSPTIDFPSFGQYFGRLILNPDQQCGDTATIRVNIFPEVEADFSYAYDTCVSEPVQFTDQSFSAIDGITNWTWEFGDNLGSSGTSPSHLYRNPGNYLVNLSVEDENGCTDEISQEISYFPVPNLIVVAPNRFENCVPGIIQFDNLSEPIDDTYLIEWNFGDGNTSSTVSPTHTYTEPGLFDVSLAITSPIGCSTDTIFRELISIEPTPIADFYFTPEETDIFNPTISFFDESMLADRYLWNFNGLSTSIDPNPVYTFQDTGRQEITLIIESQNGCRDTSIQVVDIAPVVTYHLPNAFTPNDDSKNDIFKGVGYLRGIQNFQMGIWNRWGEQIFTSRDIGTGWNGRKNNSGRMAPNGVYTYIIKFDGPRGAPFEYKGIVTLIR